MRIRILAGVGLLLVAGCATSTTGSPGPDVGKLKVVATTVVHDPRDTVGNLLSPTGRRVLGAVNKPLAGHDRFVPCVFDVNGAHEVCSDSKVSINLDAAAWSPDGRRVAFVDGGDRYEPDVHVLDAATGKTVDLTDDGVASSFDPRAELDVLPSWSPDGKSIWFARQRGDDITTVAIDSVPADGGTVTQLGTIAGMLDLNALAFSPDGKTMAWTRRDLSAENSVVHIRKVAGGDDHALSAAPVAGDQALLSFSPDGKKLLVDDSTIASVDFSKSHARVYPSDGSGPGRPVAAGVEALFPTWAPLGQALAFTTPDPHTTVQVVSRPGGTPRVIKSGRCCLSAAGERLQWISGGLLVNTGFDVAILRLG